MHLMLCRSGAVVAKYGDKSVYFDLEDLGNTTGQWDLYGSDAPSPYPPIQVLYIFFQFYILSSTRFKLKCYSLCPIGFFTLLFWHVFLNFYKVYLHNIYIFKNFWKKVWRLNFYSKKENFKKRYMIILYESLKMRANSVRKLSGGTEGVIVNCACVYINFTHCKLTSYLVFLMFTHHLYDWLEEFVLIIHSCLKCRASSLKLLPLPSLREVCCSNSWYWEVVPRLPTWAPQPPETFYQSKRVHNYHQSLVHVEKSKPFATFNLLIMINVSSL